MAVVASAPCANSRVCADAARPMRDVVRPRHTRDDHDLGGGDAPTRHQDPPGASAGRRLAPRLSQWAVVVCVAVAVGVTVVARRHVDDAQGLRADRAGTIVGAARPLRADAAAALEAWRDAVVPQRLVPNPAKAEAALMRLAKQRDDTGHGARAGRRKLAVAVSLGTHSVAGAERLTTNMLVLQGSGAEWLLVARSGDIGEWMDGVRATLGYALGDSVVVAHSRNAEQTLARGVAAAGDRVVAADSRGLSTRVPTHLLTLLDALAEFGAGYERVWLLHEQVALGAFELATHDTVLGCVANASSTISRATQAVAASRPAAPPAGAAQWPTDVVAASTRCVDTEATLFEADFLAWLLDYVWTDVLADAVSALTHTRGGALADVAAVAPGDGALPLEATTCAAAEVYAAVVHASLAPLPPQCVVVAAVGGPASELVGQPAGERPAAYGRAVSGWHALPCESATGDLVTQTFSACDDAVTRDTV